MGVRLVVLAWLLHLHPIVYSNQLVCINFYEFLTCPSFIQMVECLHPIHDRDIWIQLTGHLIRIINSCIVSFYLSSEILICDKTVIYIIIMVKQFRRVLFMLGLSAIGLVIILDHNLSHHYPSIIKPCDNLQNSSNNKLLRISR